MRNQINAEIYLIHKFFIGLNSTAAIFGFKHNIPELDP